MATYTIELRNICEIYGRTEVENWFKAYNLQDYLTNEQINSITENTSWNKDKLAKKIVDHFYMREIGLETPALFAHFAKIKMNEIMQRYLQKIYSTSLKFDPLVNVDFEETFKRNIEGNSKNSGTSSSNSSNSSNSYNQNNDTPQGLINKNDVLNGNYATSISNSENSNSIKDNTLSNSTGENKTIEDYTRKQKGNTGISVTAQKLIEQYRKIIIAIDEEIINELNSLFMGIF